MYINTNCIEPSILWIIPKKYYCKYYLSFSDICTNDRQLHQVYLQLVLKNINNMLLLFSAGKWNHFHEFIIIFNIYLAFGDIVCIDSLCRDIVKNYRTWQKFNIPYVSFKILLNLSAFSANRIISERIVLSATFSNISVISWRSVLLVEETRENHRPAASHCQTLSHNFVSSTPRLSGIKLKPSWIL
jgi:hypothetical protein